MANKNPEKLLNTSLELYEELLDNLYAQRGGIGTGEKLGYLLSGIPGKPSGVRKKLTALLIQSRRQFLEALQALKKPNMKKVVRPLDIIHSDLNPEEVSIMERLFEEIKKREGVTKVTNGLFVKYYQMKDGGRSWMFTFIEGATDIIDIYLGLEYYIEEYLIGNGLLADFTYVPIDQ